MYIVVDRDDNNVAASINSLAEYDNMIAISGSQCADIVLKPSITPAIFSSGAFSAYAVEDAEKLWLDIANTSVPHYGVKLGITSLNVSVTYEWQWLVEAWYEVSFKNIR